MMKKNAYVNRSKTSLKANLNPSTSDSNNIVEYVTYTLPPIVNTMKGKSDIGES